MTDIIDAVLARAVQELGGAHREGQTTMAHAVGGALDGGEHALIQAGTGTGKSLGYLVPAVEYAIRQQARVVVSTATLALQRQIMTKDLPLVMEAARHELGEAPRIALLKGRSNYLCRHKLAGGYPEGEDDAALPVYVPTSDLGQQVARLHDWAETTATGDRDDLIPGVSGRAWAQVSVTGRECLGSTCPVAHECFSEAAREQARTAHIIVTNHAMLGVEATGNDVLGDYDALIVDEAHELVSRITNAATLELTVARLDAAGRAARRCGVTTQPLDDAARGFDQQLTAGACGRLADGLPPGLSQAMALVRDGAREAISAVTGVQKEAKASAQVALAALGEVFDACEVVLQGDGSHVIWLAPADGDEDLDTPARLVAAPLDVAALIGGTLVGESGAVMTSATLALGGTFEPMARHLGLDQPVTLDVGSPFSYESAGIAYVAAHLPPPAREISAAALDELEALISAAGGRTLGLFSSHRAAVAATEAMRERLDVPIMYQRDDQISTLIEQFRADERTCLFGAASLWQGIDVPGPSLSLVVIDRIPFPRPDEPISQARAEAVAARGGNGFMAVAATHAALMMAQGAGRLIRSDTDRGVVAILDSRVATARYGGFLARSMPPLWATSDREVVLGALRRLDASEPALEAAQD